MKPAVLHKQSAGENQGDSKPTLLGIHLPEALSDYPSKLDSPKQKYKKQLKPPTILKPGGDYCLYFNVFCIHTHMYMYTCMPRQDVVHTFFVASLTVVVAPIWTLPIVDSTPSMCVCVYACRWVYTHIHTYILYMYVYSTYIYST